MNSDNIVLGSGYLYLLPYTGSIPTDFEIEAEVNLLGYVKDGATLKYKPTYKTIRDFEGTKKRSILTSEEATLSANVNVWSSSTLARITQTSSLDSSTINSKLSIGGLNNANYSLYLVRFVHADKNHRVTILAQSENGFDLSFQKAKEVVVSAQFKAFPFDDGSLLLYSEGGITPTDTLDITANGEYVVENYDYVDVDVVAQGNATPADVRTGVHFSSSNGNNLVGTLEPLASQGTASASEVLEGKTFSNSTDTAIPGTMSNRTLSTYHASNTAASISGSNLRLKIPYSGYFSTNNYITRPLTDFGTAKATDVLAGVTFTSENGIKITGVGTTSMYSTTFKFSGFGPTHSITINHNLGHVPHGIVIVGSHDSDAWLGIWNLFYVPSSHYSNGCFTYTNTSGGPYSKFVPSWMFTGITSTSFTINESSSDWDALFYFGNHYTVYVY